MTTGDFIRRVDHKAEGDRAILRLVYAWADANPEIYLDGSGYRDAEDFLDPPPGSLEYLVFAGGEPAALVTLIPLAAVRGVYQAGLITNPGASLRKICGLLRGFMGAVFAGMAHALFVQLPDSPEFEATRKLARFLGFRRVSANNFLILKSEYEHGNPQQKPDDDHRLPGRLQVL